METNPFSTPSWIHRTPAATAKPAPVTPVLPYHFVGRATVEGATRVFIASGERVITVGKGDTLDGQYRVESVSGTAIAFLHLPSGTHQVMLLSPPLYGEHSDAAAPRSAALRGDEPARATAATDLRVTLNADPLQFKTTITR